MRSFRCGECNTDCIDTEYGFLTGCEHRSIDCGCENRIGLCILCAMRDAIKAEGGDVERVLRQYEVRHG